MMAKVPAGVGPRLPQVVVLFGATGDLARRKLLPGLFHLVNAGFIPGCRIIGVSLDDIDTEGFRSLGPACARRVRHAQGHRMTTGKAFAAQLDYVPCRPVPCR
jgi:glucose-6-phosphate 1-dehydrogenase